MVRSAEFEAWLEEHGVDLDVASEVLQCFCEFLHEYYGTEGPSRQQLMRLLTDFIRWKPINE
jgi:hypothetical protein